jgi:hypothetical protein
MNNERANTLIKNITDDYFDFDQYPKTPLKQRWLGGLSPCNTGMNEDFHWISKAEFTSIFHRLHELCGDDKLFIVEDFERINKKDGHRTRLHDEMNNSWDAFDHFQQSTDILSFYIIGESFKWILWANRDYWLWGAEKDLFVNVDSQHITFEKMMANYSASDTEFKKFIASLGV